MGNTYNSIIDCINSSKNHNGKKEIENILNEDNNNFENKEKKKNCPNNYLFNHEISLILNQNNKLYGVSFEIYNFYFIKTKTV